MLNSSRTLILIAFGNATQFLLLLLTMRVATTLLPPVEMGRLSLITAMTAFFALFLVNPVGMFLNRRLHAWDLAGRSKFYLQWHWLFLLGVGLFAGFVLSAFNSGDRLGGAFSTGWLMLLVCGSLLFNTINQTAIPALNLLEQRTSYVTLTVGSITLSLVCAYTLAIYLAPNAESWLAGLLIGQVLFAVLGVFQLFRKLAPRKEVGSLSRGQFIKFAWPVAVSVGFNWLQTQGFRLLVADSLGLLALGMFVTGYGVSAGLIAAYESVVTTYFQPKFYERISNEMSLDQAQAWNQYAAAILPSLVVVVLLLVGLAPELTQIMVGPAYRDASEFVIWGVVAEGTRVIAGVYSLSAHAKMRTRLLILPNALGAFLCLLLIFLLVPGLGAHGVGLARAASGVLVVVTLHLLTTSDHKMELPYRGLIQATLMGLVLWACATIGRWMLGGAQGLSGSLGVIGGTGGVCLLMVFWLLHPFVNKREKVV
jgi:O-antigen/teichoic acid export membrane protein